MLHSIYIAAPVFLKTIFLNVFGLVKILRRRTFSYKYIYGLADKYYSSGVVIEPPERMLVEKARRDWKRCNPVAARSTIIDKRLAQGLVPPRKHSLIEKVLGSNINTSGSTGTPLSFLLSWKAELMFYATIDAYRSNLGFDIFAWAGYFCGNVILAKEDQEVCIRSLPNRTIYFSQYHLNEFTISKYLAIINEGKIKWIHGYPSFLLEIVRLAGLHDLQCTCRLTGITVGSETLTQSCRRELESFFNCRVYNIYCQTEMVALFTECSSGSMHVNQAFSNVDFIKLKGSKDLAVVGTNIVNRAFPIWQYDTGDVVSSVGESLCGCGHPSPVVDGLYGRVDQYIEGKSGQRIGRLDHIFKGVPGVISGQICQSKLSKNIVVKVVVDPAYDGEVLYKKLELYLGFLDVEMKIETVNFIEREPSGKQLFVKLYD